MFLPICVREQRDLLVGVDGGVRGVRGVRCGLRGVEGLDHHVDGDADNTQHQPGLCGKALAIRV